MRKTILFIALLTLPLAGCLQDPASRGLAGAAAGAVVADATGNSAILGGVVGGLGGVASCSLPAAQCRQQGYAGY